MSEPYSAEELKKLSKSDWSETLGQRKLTDRFLATIAQRDDRIAELEKTSDAVAIMKIHTLTKKNEAQAKVIELAGKYANNWTNGTMRMGTAKLELQDAIAELKEK